MILKGKNIIITLDGAAIAAAKSCSLSINTETISTSSPYDGKWKHSIPRRLSWSASCSHLVTSITQPVTIIGKVVTLSLIINPESALPFVNYVSGVTIQTGTANNVNDVVWDQTSHQFLGRSLNSYHQYIYYSEWYNMNGIASMNSEAYHTDGNLFTINGNTYILNGNTLTAEKLTGSAIVKDWDIVSSIQNLANGSFKFEGTGPLE